MIGSVPTIFDSVRTAIAKAKTELMYNGIEGRVDIVLNPDDWLLFLSSFPKSFYDGENISRTKQATIAGGIVRLEEK